MILFFLESVFQRTRKTKEYEELYGFSPGLPCQKVMEMQSISKFKQLLVGRLEAKGLESDIIPSFIRSMRICFANDPEMNQLKANRQLQFLGWNDIELDYHTLQIAIVCFEGDI